jgi:hypothetical protein
MLLEMLELHLQMFDVLGMYHQGTVSFFHDLFVALFGFLRGAFLRIFSDEFFNPSCRIHDLLPTGEEWMTL